MLRAGLNRVGHDLIYFYPGRAMKLKNISGQCRDWGELLVFKQGRIKPAFI